MYFKTLNNRPWGANNESLGGPGGPGTGFCSPGGGFFSLSRRSGLPLRLLPLKPPPGLQKPVPGPPGPPRGLVISPPGTIISRLKVFRRFFGEILADFWPRFFALRQRTGRGRSGGEIQFYNSFLWKNTVYSSSL